MSLSASTRIPRRETSLPRVAAAAGAGLLALTACGAPLESVQSPIGSENAQGAASGSFGDEATTHFVYGQDIDTLTVPSGVGYAQINVAGGSGGNADIGWGFGIRGRGTVITGTMKVKVGDVLTIVVAEQGGNPNGNKSPGEGGWSISPYEGGRGGSSRGALARDGGGGGGASVIQLNGQTMVVAAGGGGEGGQTSGGAGYEPGGDGGIDVGGRGGQNEDSAIGTGGTGGSSSNPNNDKQGQSATAPQLQGGGGGGGGGRYAGRGGRTSGWETAGGGGGGSSLYKGLTDLSFRTGADCGLFKCTDVGNVGNGWADVTWLPVDDSTDTYQFLKVGTTDQVLEVNGASTPINGTPVDTWHRVILDGAISPNHLWTYQFDAGQSAGLLVNKDTGKCLEVNATTGHIDQWECADQDNTLWKIVPNGDGSTALQVTLDDHHGIWQPGTYYLATAVDSTSVVDGTDLTLDQRTGDRTGWAALKQ